VFLERGIAFGVERGIAFGDLRFFLNLFLSKFVVVFRRKAFTQNSLKRVQNNAES